MPDLVVDGVMRVNGAEWRIAGWRGMLGHNWGRHHTQLYAWGHCNQWDGVPDLVVEGFSGRSWGRAPLVTVVWVRHRGVWHDLYGMRLPSTRDRSISPRRWTFRARGRTARAQGELYAPTDDFVGLFYPNPDGALSYCLNTKLAQARLTVTIHGAPPLEVSSNAAALEIGTRDPSHGVRMYVLMKCG
jgi:hypothetical protein